MFKKLILVFAFVFAFFSSNAQMFENVLINTFGGRMNAPVTVRVDQTGNTFTFYAENKSYYPYDFEISFNRLVNLTPRTAGEKRVLRHGTTRILKLTIENEELGHDFSYSTKYKLGDPDKLVIHDFPYLIPLAKGKIFDRYAEVDGTFTRYYLNAFKAQPGDTVYASRRGLIAALPDNSLVVDRLMEGSLEIIHEDGSAAVYRNIGKSLVDYNDEVLPGDPIGVINHTGFVAVTISKFAESRVQQLNTKFVVDETSAREFKDLIVGSDVRHPAPICERELNSKELKKFRKSRK